MKFKIRFADQIVGFFVLAGDHRGCRDPRLHRRQSALVRKNYYFTSKFASGDGLSVGMPH